MTRHEPDPILEISKIHQELDRFEIELLPPHIIKSDMDFSAEGKDIRFGLLSIKGISEKSIERINNSKYLSRVIVSNSIPQDMNCKKCLKLEVFDVSSLLSEVLKRIMTGDSLSELF